MKDSEIVYSECDYHIWFSDGNIRPYWVSDNEGTELESFESLTEAMEGLYLTYIKN